MKKLLLASTGLMVFPLAIAPVVSCTTTTAPTAKGSSAGGEFIAEMMTYLGYQASSVKYTNTSAMEAVNEMTGKENFFFSTAGQVIPSYTKDEAEVKGWKNDLTRTFTIGKTGLTFATRISTEMQAILKDDATDLKIDINEFAKVYDNDPETNANWHKALLNVSLEAEENNVNAVKAQAMHMFPIDEASQKSPLTSKMWDFLESSQSGIVKTTTWDKDFSTAATIIDKNQAINIDNGYDSLTKIKNSTFSGLIVPVTYTDLVTRFNGKFGWGAENSNGIYPITLVDTKGTTVTTDDVEFNANVSTFESTSEFTPVLTYPMTVPVNMIISHVADEKRRGYDAYTWIASQAMSPQFQEHMRAWLGIGRLSEKEIAYQTGWTFDASDSDSRVDMNWTDAEIMALSKKLEDKNNVTLKNKMSYGLNL